MYSIPTCLIECQASKKEYLIKYYRCAMIHNISVYSNKGKNLLYETELYTEAEQKILCKDCQNRLFQINNSIKYPRITWGS